MAGVMELLTGYPREVFARGDLVWAHPPGVVCWMLALAAGALLVGIGLRRRGGRRWTVLQSLSIAAFQVMFVAMIATLLAGPGLRIDTLRSGVNQLPILVDVSRSMALPAADDDPASRLARSVQVVGKIRAELAQRLKLTTFSFGAGVRPSPDLPDAAIEDATDLIASLESVMGTMGGEAVAGILVFSDGGDTSGDPQAYKRLAALDVPVHVVGSGAEEFVGEVMLTDVTLPRVASAGAEVGAVVTYQHVSAQARDARVSAYDGERLIATVPVVLPKGKGVKRTTVSFPAGEGGVRDLTFRVEVAEGDQIAGNNAQDRLLSISNRTRRILYLEGEPRWEFKFLRRAIEGDDVLRLTSWLTTTGRKTYRQGVNDGDEVVDGLPDEPGKYYDFDVIVLGSIAASRFTPAQHAWLAGFVSERGGSVLVLAGRNALADGGWDVQPLADALPVHLDREAGPGYAPLTSGGTARPVSAAGASELDRLIEPTAELWRDLPPLADLHVFAGLKPASRTLLEIVTKGDDNHPAGTYPLLVGQHYGRGTTAVLASATTWRWQMRTDKDDLRHRRFWRNLLRQLAASAQSPVELRAAASGAGIEIEIESHENVSAKPRARVTGPDGNQLEMVLTQDSIGESGRFSGGVAATPGIYQVDITGENVEPVTRFVKVGGEDIEMANPVQNRRLLERIAETTGGRYWRLDEVAGLPQHLLYASAGARVSETMALWHMPVVFLVLLLTRLCEWLLRRRWGQI